jgi:hypothetical protein
MKALTPEERLKRKRKASREWHKRWRTANPGEHRRKKAEWYLKNREKVLAQRRNKRYQKLFGITEEEYFQLLAFQNGVCAICNNTPKDTRLHVDHSHTTGEVRGLLCYKCNYSIGLLDDSPEKATRLAAYLTSPIARQVLDRDV